MEKIFKKKRKNETKRNDVRHSSILEAERINLRRRATCNILSDGTWKNCTTFFERVNFVIKIILLYLIKILNISTFAFLLFCSFISCIVLFIIKIFIILFDSVRIRLC